MVPDWITDVWENGQHKQLHATDSYYDKYKCPIFKGLKITVSQLSAEERLTIKKVIEENGGLYSGALKAHETTHLILNEPVGDKYRFAKSWKVICVNVKWIIESVEAGYCRDEALYGLDESVQTQPKRSTPKKDLTSIDLPLVDCSVIVGQPGVTHLDETMRTDCTLSLPIRKISYVPLDEFSLSSLPKGGEFLDGCKIYLTGFSSSHMDKLRKIVNSGSGMRFSKYSESISHVICGDLSEDFLQNLKSSNTKPYVINYKWLLECCKTGTLVGEKPYLCVDVAMPVSDKKEDDKPKKDSLHVSQNNSQHKRSSFHEDNMTDIFKQYICEQQLEDDKENKIEKCSNQNSSLNPKLSTSATGSKSHLNSFETKGNGQVEPDIPVIDLEPKIQPDPQNSRQADVDDDVDVEAIDDESLSSSANLFSGIKFFIVGFGQKELEILSNIIEKHSGTISNEAETCDLGIVPLVWHDLNIPVSNIVTICWLQKCVEESRIFDLDENELFRPFDIDTDKKPFESFVISFSQYGGTERDCLMHLSETLGATCQDYFVRKANPVKGVLSNTHLVVSIPDGSKYEASKKWKIPAVTKRWVIDATKLGVAPPVDNYLVDKFPELPFNQEEKTSVSHGCEIPKKNSVSRKVSEKIGTSKNMSLSTSTNQNINKNLVEEPILNPPVESTSNTEIAAKNNMSVAEVKKQNDTFSYGATLQHSRIAEICRESGCEGVKQSSPIRPPTENSLNASLNLDQSLHVKFHLSGLLNDLDNSKEETPIRAKNNKRHSLSIGEMFDRNLASALCRVDGKSGLEKDDSKLLEENGAENPKLDVLAGVVLYVSRKLSSIQTELNEVVVQLGGSYVWSYDDSCTHFVFVGKNNDITKEFREARSQGKKIVSPEWIYACREKGSRVEEDLYPHTFKANMTLSQQISIIKAPPSSMAKEVEAPEPKIHESNLLKLNEENQLQIDEITEIKNVEKVDFNKELKELLLAAKFAKKRHSKRLTGSSSSSPVAEKSPISTYTDMQVKPTSAKKNAPEETDTGSQYSQSYPITWDDPTGRLEREKIANRAIKNAEELEKSRNGDVEDLVNKVPRRKFMFTNITDALKAEYIEIVKKLGGEASDEKAFDISATHLILANPIKNEKFLSSVASGKWVLHPLFLSVSVEQNGFVDEADYEWGGPSTEQFAKDLASSNAKIAECPHRWRSKLQQRGSSGGAFDSWKIVIHADDKGKHSTYAKILEAGGAEIIPSEMVESAFDRITHVFVDMKRKGASKTDLSCYFSRGIKCVKPEYLAFYLIENPPPDIEPFLVSQEHINSMLTLSKKRSTSSSTSSRLSKKTRLK